MNRNVEKVIKEQIRIYAEENHRNIIVLADPKTLHEIRTKANEYFRTFKNEETGEIINEFVGHRIIVSIVVDEIEIVNCGYNNDIKSALEPYLKKEQEKVLSFSPYRQ